MRFKTIATIIAATLFALNSALHPLAPCATEDSTDCYWDASQHGNGQGESFIDVDGTAYYFGGAR